MCVYGEIKVNQERREGKRRALWKAASTGKQVAVQKDKCALFSIKGSAYVIFLYTVERNLNVSFITAHPPFSCISGAAGLLAVLRHVINRLSVCLRGLGSRH